MPWTYVQATGDLSLDGHHVARGYSGHGVCRNQPSAQEMPDMGPIPCGEWAIAGPPTDTAEHGPFVLRIEAAPETEAFGRAGFLMHGDSIRSPGSASRGCIIMPREVRETVWASGDRKLIVVATPAELNAVPNPGGSNVV